MNKKYLKYIFGIAISIGVYCAINHLSERKQKRLEKLKPGKQEVNHIPP